MVRSLCGAAACLGAALPLITAAPAGAAAVSSPPLSADLAEAGTPALTVRQGGRERLALDAGVTFGLRAGGTWRRATRVLSSAPVAGGGRTVTLATDDPEGRRLVVRLAPAGDGVLALRIAPSGGAAGGVEALRAGFARRPGERHLGFGERNDTVARTSGTVVNLVTEGPFANEREYDIVSNTIPPWALRRAKDATYFPMPWALSSLGYGLLVDEDRTSRFSFDGPWTVEVDGASLRMRILAGPGPREVLRRLTAITGRQPAPAAPWVLGPWVQTGHQNTSPGEGSFLAALRRADAPLSVVETHMRYSPCVASIGQDAAERARTAGLRAQGVVPLTYMNSEVCEESPVFGPVAAAGGFQRRADGTPYTFTAFAGSGPKQVGQYDFAREAGRAGFAGVADRTLANGYQGFMEDYGEYTPPDSVSGAGLRGEADGYRNRYPVDYHCAGQAWADRQEVPIARWVRSGWTGVHPCAPIVWGGDPTTDWGFDGLRSVVTGTLSAGLSGVSVWATDIGGFFTLSPPRLTPELLARWIQVGVTLGVMRTKAEGIGVPLEGRPQVWEEPTLPIWRRYAKLRTQLYPYLVAAQAEYRRTGVPLTRHMLLADPGDARAPAIEDQYLMGPDLLAAPVLEPGATTRRARLPRGAWVPFWDAVRYEARTGALSMRAATPQRGRRSVTARAPLDTLPLWVRAGALLPLLPSDVDTLASTGADGLTTLADRAGRLTLLAFPRGASRARFDRDGVATSRETATGWVLRVEGRGARTVSVQASMRTLRRPLRPCAVRGARSWRWEERTGVLRAVLPRGRSAVLRVTACGRAGARRPSFTG